jgi:hypothetical protein
MHCGVEVTESSTSKKNSYLSPTNINELRAKNPEPTHPERDPTTQPASHIWPQKADTCAWWEEEEGQEYIQQHLSVKQIAKYFRTRSQVSAADLDGWRARELMVTLFMGDDEELQSIIRDHLILPYLFGDFLPSHIQEYAGDHQVHLHYFDYCGNVLDIWGKTGGQQGDPLEMIVFCLTVHHLWGLTLAKHNQDACAVAYADDGYIKAKLSVNLEVLSDIKQVLKEDAGLALNDKTKILIKGISAADAHAAAQRLLIANLFLAHLSPLLSTASCAVDCYIVLEVPTVTLALGFPLALVLFSSTL